MDFYEIIDYIGHFSAFSIILPLILIIKRITEKQHKILFVYLLLVFITEMVSLLFKSDNNIRSIIFSLYVILEISLICKLYLFQFNQSIIRFTIKLFWLLFLTVSILIYIFNENYFDVFLFLHPIQNAVIIIIGFIYLYRIINKSDSIDFLKDYFFWINIAFIIYFGSQFLINLGMQHVDTSIKSNIYILGFLHFILNILYNILLAIGIYKIKRV
jgi:hypothetical protein